MIRERAEHRSYEAVVSITAGEVRLWREVAGVQPAVMLEEFLATEAAVKKDARWQEAMRRRGVTDFDMVMTFCKSIRASTTPGTSVNPEAPTPVRSSISPTLMGEPEAARLLVLLVPVVPVIVLVVLVLLAE